MRLFVNPYTGGLMDLDAIPESPGGAKFCPSTGKPLNEAAVLLSTYAGPERDRDTWARESLELVREIEAQASRPTAVTLGIDAPAEPAQVVG